MGIFSNALRISSRLLFRRICPLPMGSSHSKSYLTTSKVVKAALPQLKDPYAYTDGHWLHRDKEQRQARQLDFNFSKLSQIALDAIKDATRIISYEKKEGGYNRVFIFKLDTGDQVVAKIPTPVAGAP
ncbi:hypothetical protein MAP00_004219 [Monascus purpureus]|nr:hypothetical protein MAP00_004219 [Monascus purpureus]